MKYGYGISLESISPVSLDDLEDVESSQIAIKAPSYQFQAICTSEACCGNKSGVQKNVARSIDECLECGDFLFWSKQVLA